jgi:small subunit ribosomal protein S6
MVRRFRIKSFYASCNFLSLKVKLRPMRNYQLVLVLRPTLSESERKKITETVKGWLKDVKVSKEEDWGQKALAYKIKKETAGYYINYELEAEVIPGDFEKRLIGQDSVIRHLLIRSKAASKKQEVKTEEKKEEKEVKPKAIKTEVKVVEKKTAKKPVKKAKK